ncbi:hypothetical protein K6Y31_09740 [Motilimonas cestriensis]|uniref:DUF4476 domain-containing protein n=1 Tax=Motilimonas cestriensis TaxID=2742685 RepID=A0ABS8WBD6_9GAMM|nr:hypothetical protein [Motilimonas cestriensis]MCE2595099.1 hypothetical protein [Motilimonas cestriensis]
MKMPMKHLLLAAAVFSCAANASISEDLSAGTSLDVSINNALQAGDASQVIFEQVASTNPDQMTPSFQYLAQLPNSDLVLLLEQALVAAKDLDAQIQDDIIVAAIELADADEALVLEVFTAAINNSSTEAQLDIIAASIAAVGATEEARLEMRLSIAKRASDLGITEDTLLAGYAASGADTAELEATAAGGPVTTTGTTPTGTGNGAGTGGGGITASNN